MRGYLEDLKAGGRPMTDKELAEHYKHLYSKVKKQKDDVVEYLKKWGEEPDADMYIRIKEYKEFKDLLRMLGEIVE